MGSRLNCACLVCLLYAFLGCRSAPAEYELIEVKNENHFEQVEFFGGLQLGGVWHVKPGERPARIRPHGCRRLPVAIEQR